MNIAQIAKLAGVSSAAVSRYFNNGYISEEKREAIRRVVEETGYRPSLQARTLRTRRTMMIGVVAPKMASSAVGRVVDGLLQVFGESSYQMLLAVTKNDPKKELEYLTAFREKNVDGIILIATVFTEEHRRLLEQIRIPVVIVGQYLEGHASVCHDDYHATFDLTIRMLRKGRTHLGYIGVLREDEAVGTARYQGFLDALESEGILRQPGHYTTADFSYHSGYEKALELSGRMQRMDGLVCATDEIAVGAMHALMDRGIRVPEDVMIAGQGDSLLAKVADHAMLTVHYSYEKSGELAARLLLSKLEGERQVLEEVRLGYHIVENTQKA